MREEVVDIERLVDQPLLDQVAAELLEHAPVRLYATRPGVRPERSERTVPGNWLRALILMSRPLPS